MSLEKLFQHIIQSEQTAETRRENILKVKKQISQYDADLKAVRESCVSSKGRLHIFIHQLHESKAEFQVLLEQKKVLEEKKNEVLRDVYTLDEKLEAKKKIESEMMSDFFKEVQGFCAKYDLTRSGAEKRRSQKLDSLEEMRRKKQGLERQLDIAQAGEEKATELMAQQACFQAEISQLQSEIIDEDSKLEKKRAQRIAAQGKVDKYKVDSHSDPEILQLKRELDLLKNVELESRLRGLKTELFRVQRKQCQENQQNPLQQTYHPQRGYKFHTPMK